MAVAEDRRHVSAWQAIRLREIFGGLYWGCRYMLGLYGDIGIMEKKMETTVL